jgi:hypothetical protein
MNNMKKGTSYIVVAAMMMGLMLTGCGGNDNSVTKATTEAETEAVTEEQDTETQDTADDTEDSSVAIDEEDTEDSEEAEADPSIVGVYTKNGYENSYFGFKINLEGSYGIQTRGSLLTATDISEVVEDSNSDETVQRALDNLDNSFTVGNDYAFCANDGTHYILLKIKSPKGGGNYGYDVWADENTVAKATVAQMDTVITSTASRIGAEASNIETDYSKCTVFGEEHYICTATADMSGTEYSLTNVIVRSDDGKYTMIIAIETLGDRNYQDILDNMFSPL